MSESREHPDLQDLVGDDLEPSEREQLERVHAMLLEAGPPPELPPSLAHAPKPPSARVIPMPRRFSYTAIAVAAIAALAIFGAGYLVAGGPDPQPVETLAMSGTGGATAELALFAKDDAGNWPMELNVSGLPAGSYELWLTRDGELAASCGFFAIAGDEVTVPLNAPYRLMEFDGWVVVPKGGDERVLTT
jgi:hypothetical protein